LTISNRLLVGRLLTRSGDQAWDFSLPIVLLYTFPNQLRIAALFYLIVKLVHVVFMPRVAMVIDSTDRFTVVKLGLGLQAAGVLISVIPLGYWTLFSTPAPEFADGVFLLSFLGLVFGGVLGTFGSSLMDIAISNDLLPSVIPSEKLALFNSRFRQVDLLTEVASPVVAGIVLALKFPGFLNAGFFIIAFWNLCSFIPEILILKSIFAERPDLYKKPTVISQQVKISLFAKLGSGWRTFAREPVALVMLAYSILWLSALSPHGVLLTGFLKDGWHLEEWKIGLFRGGGAIFGLLATVIFPVLVKRISVVTSNLVFLSFQALTLTLAGVVFWYEGGDVQPLFLLLILFSRTGLYGFSLGEIQIRQTQIDPSRRGLINGFGSSLNGVATLILFGVGALLPSTGEFRILIYASVASVVGSLCVYTIWMFRARVENKQ